MAKRDELDKQRVSELESLLHKYKNVRKEMDIAQGLERSKLDVLEKKVSVKHYDTFDSRKSSIYYGRGSERKSTTGAWGKTLSTSHFRKSQAGSPDKIGYSSKKRLDPTHESSLE